MSNMFKSTFAEDKKTSMQTVRWISAVTGKTKWYIGILLLVQMILGISSVFYALVLRSIIDAAVSGNNREFFLVIAAFAGLVVFQIALRAVNRYMEEYSRATMENCFKRRLFNCLLQKDYGKMTCIHSGEWMNRLTSDTVVVADGLSQIIPGAAGMLVKLLGALVMILVLCPIFGYILIPGGILLIILTYGFRKVLKNLHKKVQEADGNMRIFLQECLSSMLVVRAFVKEEQTLKEASDRMEVHKKARMKKNHFANVCNIGFGGVMQGAYVIGAGVCGYGILMGTMSYGTLMAVLQLIGQIQSPFANITGYLPRFYAMTASADRLREVENHADIYNDSYTDAEIICFYRNSLTGITFSHADFTYAPLTECEKYCQSVVLHNINLTIKKGEYVAFTGPSGCGKSTLLKIMMGLYSLDAGEVMLESADAMIPLNAVYRRLFAYVPQGNHLMSGTIREIVAFSDVEEMQQEERLWKALEIACAKEFVSELPSDIDTVLGERGLGLSEGQMQRIAIARAVFSVHPILMLDESTSALDEHTEKQLLSNLRAMTDKTVLIVTHRSAVLSICDKKINFTENGCKMERCYD